MADDFTHLPSRYSETYAREQFTRDPWANKLIDFGINELYRGTGGQGQVAYLPELISGSTPADLAFIAGPGTANIRAAQRAFGSTTDPYFNTLMPAATVYQRGTFYDSSGMVEHHRVATESLGMYAREFKDTTTLPGGLPNQMLLQNFAQEDIAAITAYNMATGSLQQTQWTLDPETNTLTPTRRTQSQMVQAQLAEIEALSTGRNIFGAGVSAVDMKANLTNMLGYDIATDPEAAKTAVGRMTALAQLAQVDAGELGKVQLGFAQGLMHMDQMERMGDERDPTRAGRSFGGLAESHASAMTESYARQLQYMQAMGMDVSAPARGELLLGMEAGRERRSRSGMAREMEVAELIYAAKEAEVARWGDSVAPAAEAERRRLDLLTEQMTVLRQAAETGDRRAVEQSVMGMSMITSGKALAIKNLTLDDAAYTDFRQGYADRIRQAGGQEALNRATRHIDIQATLAEGMEQRERDQLGLAKRQRTATGDIERTTGLRIKDEETSDAGIAAMRKHLVALEVGDPNDPKTPHARERDRARDVLVNMIDQAKANGASSMEISSMLANRDLAYLFKDAGVSQRKLASVGRTEEAGLQYDKAKQQAKAVGATMAWIRSTEATIQFKGMSEDDRLRIGKQLEAIKEKASGGTVEDVNAAKSMMDDLTTDPSLVSQKDTILEQRAILDARLAKKLETDPKAMIRDHGELVRREGPLGEREARRSAQESLVLIDDEEGKKREAGITVMGEESSGAAVKIGGTPGMKERIAAEAQMGTLATPEGVLRAANVNYIPAVPGVRKGYWTDAPDAQVEVQKGGGRKGETRGGSGSSSGPIEITLAPGSAALRVEVVGSRVGIEKSR